MNLDVTLYVITDSNMEEAELLTRVQEACMHGASIIQLREKTKTTSAMIALAKKVKQITDHFDIPLIIDDRLDVALAINASGVHVGAEDMDVATARRLLGPDKIVGATAKTVETALQAQADGADYLGVGAIYPTTTKVKTKITSVETLSAITQACDIPVAAIGGLQHGNLDVLKESGIAGVCVVSAIMKAEDAGAAVCELKSEIEALLN